MQVQFSPVSAVLHSDFMTITPSDKAGPGQFSVFGVQLLGTGVAP